MKSYAKGARAELELIHYLNSVGFSCVRSASSGNFLYPMDIVAIKKGLTIAIESKNYAKKPRPDKAQLSQMSEWCAKAGAIGLVGWRTPESKWLFLRLEDAVNGNYEDENWMERDVLLKALDFR